ncbi:MAG: preprotein translocase subunit SecE [Candidatus Margulisiibacteriota bacterium]
MLGSASKIAGVGNKVTQFLRETLAELKKVTWPDRKYVTVASTMILVIVILVAFFVMLVDFGFAEVFKILTARRI